MVDSTMVLWGQTIAYSLYCLVILLVMSWFALRITRDSNNQPVRPAFFYAFVAFLTVLGVSLHLITYNTIPWVSVDLDRSSVTPDKSFSITVEKHQFILPANPMVINQGETVRFDVTSHDLTYGFGLFRADHLFPRRVQHLYDSGGDFGRIAAGRFPGILL